MQGMDEEHKNLLIHKHSCLVAILSKKIKEVCEYLSDPKVWIITTSMKENVMAEETSEQRSSELLRLIPNRGARAFQALCEACEKNGLIEAADILQKDRTPQISATGSVITVGQEENSLPDKWPTEKHFDRVRDNKLLVKNVTYKSNPDMRILFASHQKNNDIYPMHHRCRGNALIINIERFTDSKLPWREGSKFDEKGLQQLFSGLGFHVKNEKKDWSEKEIDTVIAEEANTDHSDHDCFVFFIMTHGMRARVQDTHGKFINITSIIDRFVEVDDLKNKPKLFFFQACQADNNDDSHSRGGSGDGAEDDIKLNMHGGASSESKENLLNILPDDDVYVFKSSPAGTRSIHNTEWGSWFTQAVIYVFSEFAYKCEIIDLFSKVNDLIYKAEVRGEPKNIGVFLTRLHRNLYFFPGLFKEN